MKKLCLLLPLVLFISGCTQSYKKYTLNFSSSFDTLTTVTGYARSEQDFAAFAGGVEDELVRLHRLFDIYNDYEGINNLKTVNDNSGIAPVRVEPELIELAELGIEWHGRTGGAVNMAMGPVLAVWHDCRERRKLPSDELLSRKAELCDISNVVVNREAGTLFLTERGMSLDVGALAKGYASGLAADAADASLVPSFIISAGGNVTIHGAPLDGRDAWSVGIQDPDDPGGLLDTILLSGGSAVTSGDYQRYFELDGKRYAHIIDPETLYPAEKHRSVTVIGPDSGIADILSTALFIMDEPNGRALAEAYGYTAIWAD